jgi:hypothetical protein
MFTCWIYEFLKPHAAALKVPIRGIRDERPLIFEEHVGRSPAWVTWHTDKLSRGTIFELVGNTGILPRF